MAGFRNIALAACLGALTLVMAPAGAADQSTGAIGRIVPASGIIDIHGPSGARVTSVAVRPGQMVKAGTLLMTTQGVTAESDPGYARNQLAAARQLSQQQVVAQTQAVQVADIKLRQLQKTLQIQQALGASITSKKELDRLTDETAAAQASLNLEKAQLRVVSSQSGSALQTAQRQFDLALQGAELRAPISGTVLRIARRPGEQLSAEPAIQIGDLSSMYVVCQVYEGDLLRLKPGMRATVRAQPLAKPLYGQIEEIGRIIDTRTRLAEVRVKLDSIDPAARLVGMEVEVDIAR